MNELKLVLKANLWRCLVLSGVIPIALGLGIGKSDWHDFGPVWGIIHGLLAVVFFWVPLLVFAEAAAVVGYAIRKVTTGAARNSPFRRR